MTLKQIIILIAVNTILAAGILGQGKEISEIEAAEQLSPSFMKILKFPYRKKRTTETFSEGKLINTVVLKTENIEPNESRELRTSISDGEKEEIETIKIGSDYYCRENTNDWRKITYPCHSYFDKEITNDEGTSKYTIENIVFQGKKAKLIREYVEYRSYESDNTYLETKYWISNDDFLVKQVVVMGDTKTKVVFRRMTETTEYSPKDLKIEAPKLKDKSVSEKVFQTILKKAKLLKERKSYRRVRFNKVLKENGLKLVREYTMIDEVLLPNKRYYYYRDEESELITTIEEITIGKKYFERKNGGKWKTTRSLKFGFPGGEKIVVEKKKIKFLGIEKYKNKNFKLYEIFEKFSSNAAGDIERTIRYRFDETGLLWSKTTSERNLRDNLIIFITDNYDFNANFKIELPNLRLK